VKLSFRTAASAEIAHIRDWIARDSPANADAVVSRILDAIEQTLPSYPSIGRSGRVRGTREWPVTGLPYVIVYEVDLARDLITILSVEHAARRR
jgi:plasmid stabilization system protein ParE